MIATGLRVPKSARGADRPGLSVCPIPTDNPDVGNGRGRRPAHTRRFWVAFGCLALLLAPGAAGAQTPAPAETPAAVAVPETPPIKARQGRYLYFGMWTTHLKQARLSLDNNWVAGVAWGGFFGATFMNSYGRRAFTGGLQRTIASTDRLPFGLSIGYRLGFITGYDGRLMRLARKTPVLPLAQPFVAVDISRIRLETSYTFVVASVAISYRF